MPELLEEMRGWTRGSAGQQGQDVVGLNAPLKTPGKCLLQVPSSNQSVSDGEGRFCLLPGVDEGKNQARICKINVSAFPRTDSSQFYPEINFQPKCY